jgi:hypothetical protein
MRDCQVSKEAKIHHLIKFFEVQGDLATLAI